MEQKYQIGNAYGSITWDIGKILNDQDKFIKRVYDVKYLVCKNPFHGDPEHVMNTDITQPLIVVELTEGIEKLIDGNHRLQKALKLDVEKIAAYVLSFEEHRHYIVDYEEKTYHDVINHWEK